MNLTVSTPPLVITSLLLDENPSNHLKLEIVGRPSGILAVLLRVFGLAPESRLKVTRTEATFVTTSLRGVRHLSVPLRRVQGTDCGSSESILALILTILFTIGAVILLLMFTIGHLDELLAPFIALALCAVIAAIVYFFSSRIWIGISSGTPILKVRFKRGVLENVRVDMNSLLSGYKSNRFNWLQIAPKSLSLSVS
jgi:VIT1/CCC1 family predicted Fe2+/Mn2+ transporter